MAKPIGTLNFSAAEVETLRQAQKLGLAWTPPRTLRGAVERNPNPYGWTERDDRWLLALAEAGWTQGLAANEMDRPIQTVLRHSKQLGIQWPHGNKSRKGTPVSRPDSPADVASTVK